MTNKNGNMDTLRFIYAYTTKNNRPATLREIIEATDTNSTSVVSYRLKGLASQGLINREPFIARGLEVTEAGRQAIGVLD